MAKTGRVDAGQREVDDATHLRERSPSVPRGTMHSETFAERASKKSSRVRIKKQKDGTRGGRGVVRFGNRLGFFARGPRWRVVCGTYQEGGGRDGRDEGRGAHLFESVRLVGFLLLPARGGDSPARRRDARVFPRHASMRVSPEQTSGKRVSFHGALLDEDGLPRQAPLAHRGVRPHRERKHLSRGNLGDAESTGPCAEL